MKDLSREILNKIKEAHIKPVPKWQFMLKKSFIWTLFVFSVLLGGLAVSSVIFHLNDVDWDVYSRFNDFGPGFVLMIIPYFWLIVMGAFLFSAIYNFKHTTGGYKYGTFLIILVSMLLSLVVGIIIYYADINEAMEENVMRKVPLYPQMMPKEMIWNNAQRGLLTGTIIQVKDPQIFLLKNEMGRPWIVDYSRAVWESGLEPEKGERIRILGKQTDKDHFDADEIRPWSKKGKKVRMTIMMTTRRPPPKDDAPGPVLPPIAQPLTMPAFPFAVMQNPLR